jgi:hypothetical protein
VLEAVEYQQHFAFAQVLDEALVKRSSRFVS